MQRSFLSLQLSQLRSRGPGMSSVVSKRRSTKSTSSERPGTGVQGDDAHGRPRDGTHALRFFFLRLRGVSSPLSVACESPEWAAGSGWE